MVALTQPIARSERRQINQFNLSQSRVNVGSEERTISRLGGGLIALYGLSRGNLSGLLAAGVGAALAYRGFTGHGDMYQALGVSTAEHKRSTAIPSGQGLKIEESVTIMKPAEELFAFWRKLENLPRIMG